MLTDKERAEIRRKLMEHTEEPPANAWKAIHAEIKPRRRWRFAWWLTGVVLLLLTSVGVFYLIAYKTGQEGNIPTASVSQPKAGSVVPATPQAVQPKVTQPQTSVQPGENSPSPARQIDQNTTETGKEIQPLPSNIPEERVPSGNVSALTPEDVPGKGKIDVKTPLNAVLADKEKDTPVPEKKENAKEPALQIRPEIVAKPQIRRPDQTSDLPSAEKNPDNDSPDHAEPIRISGKTPTAIANTGITVKPGQISRNDTETENGLFSGSEEKSGSGMSARRKDTKASKTVLVNRETIFAMPSRVLHADSSIHELVLDSASLAVRPKPEVFPVKKSIIITPEKKPATKEWTIGVFFSPRYAFRVVTPTSSDDIYITGLSNTKKSGADRMGYEAGINLSKTIGRNLYLETSLAFMQLKENLSYNYTTGAIDTLLRTVSPDGKEVQVNALYVTGNRQLVSSYAYGGWRIGATYYFWQNQHRRFNFTLNGGVNLLVKGQTREIINGQESRTVYFPSKENILEQTNYNLQAGAGYSVRVMQNYELMLMPTLNYFLASTFKTREPFGLKPYSLGIHVQLKRRFPL